jgi:predicted LPLAT superfamily acyltransferase
LKEINPDFETNNIDADSIGPETIFALQNEVENGGLVVILGDRTSAHSEKCIKHDFLGKTACFPYGVYLIASLLKAPVFFVFGLRTKSASLFPKNNIFVEKAKTDFDCNRAEAKKRIVELCGEYAATLEKYSIKYPNQWYNFYDFWQNIGEENG